MRGARLLRHLFISLCDRDREVNARRTQACLVTVRTQQCWLLRRRIWVQVPSLSPSSSCDPSRDNVFQPRKSIPSPAFKVGWCSGGVFGRSHWVLKDLFRVPSKPPVGWRSVCPRAVGSGCWPAPPGWWAAWEKRSSPGAAPPGPLLPLLPAAQEQQGQGWAGSTGGEKAGLGPGCFVWGCGWAQRVGSLVSLCLLSFLPGSRTLVRGVQINQSVSSARSAPCPVPWSLV